MKGKIFMKINALKIKELYNKMYNSANLNTSFMNFPAPMYIIRVFNMEYSFDNYTDDVYMRRSEIIPDDTSYAIPESEVDPETVVFEVRTWNANELINAWHYVFDRFEGHTYCVKAIIGSSYEDLIIGGILDPDDIVNLEEQVNELYPIYKDKYISSSQNRELLSNEEEEKEMIKEVEENEDNMQKD
jgi:hypothetical protein